MDLTGGWVGPRATCSWGPPSLLYNGYRVKGVKQPGRGVEHSPAPSFEVKERVGYTCTSPLGVHNLL